MSDILKDFQSGNKNMYFALNKHFAEINLEGLFYIKESKIALWSSETAALNYLRRQKLLDDYRIKELSHEQLDEFMKTLPLEKAKRLQCIFMP